MITGETLAARSLALSRRTADELESKEKPGWAAEAYATLDAPELKDLVDRLDRETAVQHLSKLRQEFMEAFTLRRDHIYARRGRRWLFTRGHASKMNNAYEQWIKFVRENLLVNFDALLAKSTDTLSKEPFNKTMELKSVS